MDKIVDIYDLKNFNDDNLLKLKFVINKNIISEIWANNDIVKTKDIDLKIKMFNNYEGYLSKFDCDISNIILKYLKLENFINLNYKFKIKNLSSKITLQTDDSIITIYDGLNIVLDYYKYNFINYIYIYDIFNNNNVPTNKMFIEQNGIFEIYISQNREKISENNEFRYNITKRNERIPIFNYCDLINTHIILNCYRKDFDKINNPNKVINKYELPIYQNKKQIGVITLEEYVIYEKSMLIFSKLIDYNNYESIQIIQLNKCNCEQYNYFLKRNKDLNDDNIQKKIFKCDCFVKKLISKINKIYTELYFNSDDIYKILHIKKHNLKIKLYITYIL